MICNTCNADKNINEFPKNKSKKNGVGPSCKECRRKYYAETKERVSFLRKQSYEIHKNEILERNKEYRNNTKPERDEYNKKYYAENSQLIKKRIANYKKAKLITDPYFKMITLLSSRIRNAFNRHSKGSKTKSCKEYGIDFAAIYSKIGPRPSKKHHLDHIIPITLFNLSIPEHVRLAHIPNNLRWVESKTNLKKNKFIQLELITSDPLLNEIYLMLINTESIAP